MGDVAGQRRRMLERRGFMTGTMAAATAGLASATAETPMYGLIGKMLAQPGKRDELIGHLLAGAGAMPGCLSYVVATDAGDPDAVWITEVWDSREDHAASLKLAQVQRAIAKARPLIAGFGERFEVQPVGGMGLARRPI